jgi:hypothetical protein
VQMKDDVLSCMRAIADTLTATLRLHAGGVYGGLILDAGATTAPPRVRARQCITCSSHSAAFARRVDEGRMACLCGLHGRMHGPRHAPRDARARGTDEPKPRQSARSPRTLAAAPSPEEEA